MTTNLSVALVCSEPSGDALGAGLAQALKKIEPSISLFGVTGPLMREQGVESWFDYEQLAVMGFGDVLSRVPSLIKLKNSISNNLEKTKPNMFVGLDAPDLNMRLGEQFARNGGKYVQYVCPSFWFWRTSRKKKLAKYCAQVLTLLPFEKQFCDEANIPATFVGHRQADNLYPDSKLRNEYRTQLGIEQEKTVLALLPGSRGQELKIHIPLFSQAAKLCKQQIPNLEIWMAPLTKNDDNLAIDKDIKVCVGKAHELLFAADLALVKSGTISLEAALIGCPQIVSYRLSTFDYLMLKLLVANIYEQSYCLPNLILKTNCVPELMQKNATPEILSQKLLELMDPTLQLDMQNSYVQIRNLLKQDADQKAADAVLELIRK